MDQFVYDIDWSSQLHRENDDGEELDGLEDSAAEDGGGSSSSGLSDNDVEGEDDDAVEWPALSQTQPAVVSQTQAAAPVSQTQVAVSQAISIASSSSSSSASASVTQAAVLDLVSDDDEIEVEVEVQVMTSPAVRTPCVPVRGSGRDAFAHMASAAARLPTYNYAAATTGTGASAGHSGGGGAAPALSGRKRPRMPSTPADGVRGPPHSAGTPAQSWKKGAGGSGAGGSGGGSGGGSSRSWGAQASGPPPFWKKVPGTHFLVDAFRYGHHKPAIHFLTHFHSDHYGGLSRDWTGGPIYCSPVTAALVAAKLRVPTGLLRPLPMNQPVIVAGVRVHLMDANHCPGAAMILFEVPVDYNPTAAAAAEGSSSGGSGGGAASAATTSITTYFSAGGGADPGAVARALSLHRGTACKAYLHVGDFRWHPRMAQYAPLRRYLPTAPQPQPLPQQPQPLQLPPSLRVVTGAAALPPQPPAPAPAPAAAAAVSKSLCRLDCVFLDTTYASPRYAFPSQDASIAAVVQLVRQYAHDPGVLFLFGTYTIGKERAFLAAAEALGPDALVYVDNSKHQTLSLLQWPPEHAARLTRVREHARIHVVPLGYLTLAKLQSQWRRMKAAAGASASNSKSLAANRAASSSSSRSGGIAAAFGRAQGQGQVQSPAAPVASISRSGSLTANSASNSGGGGIANALDVLTASAKAAAAAAAVAASRRTYGPFHSIVAFRLTGWSHQSNADAGARNQRFKAGDTGRDDAEGAAAPSVSVLGQSRLTNVSAPPNTMSSSSSSSSSSSGDGALCSTQSVGARAPATSFGRTAGAAADIDDAPLDAHRVSAGSALMRGRVLGMAGAAAAAAVAAASGASATGSAADGVRDVRSGGSMILTVMPPGAAAPVGVSVGVATRGSKYGAVARAPPAASSSSSSSAAKHGASAAACTGGGGGVTLYSLPYSEHSSFTELVDAVRCLDPLMIIPTVNCRNAADASAMVRLLRQGH